MGLGKASACVVGHMGLTGLAGGARAQENAQLEQDAARLAAALAGKATGEDKGALADILAASERMQRDKAQARAVPLFMLLRSQQAEGPHWVEGRG